MVAAASQSAEGEPPAGADSGCVPVHHAAGERPLAAIERLLAARVHARRETVVRGIGDLQRLFLGCGRVDGEVGTEELFTLVSGAAALVDEMHRRTDVAPVEPARPQPARSKEALRVCRA